VRPDLVQLFPDDVSTRDGDVGWRILQVCRYCRGKFSGQRREKYCSRECRVAAKEKKSVPQVKAKQEGWWTA